ncbi:MAG: PHP domain-containing protein [Patescibacteria group bacterium]
MIRDEPQADMHLHSTFSDGELSPRELVRLAKEKGLTGICLTDHETIAGEKEFKAALAEFNMRGIMGAEFFAQFEEKIVHLLVYGVNADNWHFFEKIAKKNHAAHEHYARTILERYRRAKLMDVNLDEVKMFRTNRGPFVNFVDILYFRANKYQLNPFEVHEELCQNFGRMTNLQLDVATAEEIFEASNKADTVVSWAHSGLQLTEPDGQEYLREAIPYFVTKGLKALEVNHPANTALARTYLSSVCLQRNLYKTGGSDFHGPVVHPKIKFACVTAHERCFAELWRKLM